MVSASVVDVHMPSLGADAVEGTIVRWLRHAGDAIAVGDLLAEIVTDKVSDELRAGTAGVLGAPFVQAGQTVPVGAVVVTISTTPVEPTSLRPDEVPTQGLGRTGHRTPEFEPENTRTSPLVRRLAAENGIDLATTVGTGPGGRVTKDDINALLNKDGGRAHALEIPNGHQRSEGSPTLHDGSTTLAPSFLRQAIAAHLTRSVQTIPQAWTVVEVDLTGLLELRAQHADRVNAETGSRLSTFGVFARTVVQVVQSHPLLNATWRDGIGGIDARGDTGGSVALHRKVHLGVAVARPSGGLVVPVVRNAQDLDLPTFMTTLTSIVSGARTDALGSDAYHGGTITVNNTGALGSVSSQPILPIGTSAILTLEAITRRPVVVQLPGAGAPERSGMEAIAIRPMVNVCLTFDHRVMDGQEACAFLQDLRQSIESLSAQSPLR